MRMALPRQDGTFRLRAGDLAALLLIALAAFLRDDVAWIAQPPDAWVLPFASWLSAAADWLKNSFDLGLFTFTELTRAIAYLLGLPLSWGDAVLVSGIFDGTIGPMSWLALVCLAGLLGIHIQGWRLAMLAAGGTLYLALSGQWSASMRTLSMVLVVVPIAALAGITLGIAATRNKHVGRFVNALTDLMQSVPHYAYFVPVVFFFGIGAAAGAIATIVFAMPPMVRCTVLGIRRIPLEILEAARMMGCTDRQMLFKVQLPVAAPTLLTGLNQVIMQTLAMVVIASLIGVRGLGYDLLFSLQNLRLGRAMEQGLAIVVIAIVLDRLSQAYAREQPWLRRREGNWARRHWRLAAAVGAFVTIEILAQAVPALRTFPADWTFSNADFWDEQIRRFTDAVYEPVSVLRDFLIIYVFLPIKSAFQWLPWPILVTALAWLAHRLDGVRLALLVSLLALTIVFSGLWASALLTMYLATIALGICILIGVPVGIAAAENRRFGKLAILWCDTFQTFPSFVYLIPVVMLFRVGDIAAVMAVVVWAVIPIVRYTCLGLRGVPEHVLEAGRAFGCTRWQLLWRVKLPLAMPEILLGVNQCVMFSLFMVIIAALIGTQDLGKDIMLALSYSDIGGGMMAGLCIAFIAIIADRLIGGWALRRKAALGLG